MLRRSPIFQKGRTEAVGDHRSPLAFKLSKLVEHKKEDGKVGFERC